MVAAYPIIYTEDPTLQLRMFKIQLLSMATADGCDATHYMIRRFAKTDTINNVPEEFITDYHLEVYCIEFYKRNKYTGYGGFVGTELHGLETDKMLPLHNILKAQ